MPVSRSFKSKNFKDVEVEVIETYRNSSVKCREAQDLQRPALHLAGLGAGYGLQHGISGFRREIHGDMSDMCLKHLETSWNAAIQQSQEATENAFVLRQLLGLCFGPLASSLCLASFAWWGAKAHSSLSLSWWGGKYEGWPKVNICSWSVRNLCLDCGHRQLLAGSAATPLLQAVPRSALKVPKTGWSGQRQTGTSSMKIRPPGQVSGSFTDMMYI